MRTRVSSIVVSLVVLASAAGQAQQTVTIPVAAKAQQGKVTKSKMTVKMNGSMTVAGKSIPIDMQGTVLTTESYGTAGSDGLFPVATSMATSGWRGVAEGKSISVPGAVLPTTTAYYDSLGEVKKVSAAGASASLQDWKAQAQGWAQSAALARPPVGQLEIGKPIVKDASLPFGASKVRMQVSWIPTEVADVGGERAVKFQVQSNTDFDLKDTPGQPGGPGASGSGTVTMSGGMSVGLQTGEIIRQYLNQSVVGIIDVGQASIAMQMRMTVEGYRTK